MTATDELRRLLDERGVEWDELQSYEGGEMTRWRDSMGRYVTAYDDGIVAFFDDFYWHPTARQAIDATLGRGTCRNVGYYIDGTRFKCSACGYNGWVKWASDGMDRVPHYCPSCGAEVVDA